MEFRMDLRELIAGSFLAAAEAVGSDKGKREKHSGRSQKFVAHLSHRLEIEFTKRDNYIKVFSKSINNQKHFKRSEFLYDILVCRISPKKSFRQGKEIMYIKEPLLEIESELAKDSRQAIIDFSKLVIGSAKYKLFIGSHWDNKNKDKIKEFYIPVAEACSGMDNVKVYLALIPHPEEKAWESNNDSPMDLSELIDIWELAKTPGKDSEWVQYHPTLIKLIS